MIKANLKNGKVVKFADAFEAAKYFKRYYSNAQKLETVKYNIDSAIRGEEQRYDKSPYRHSAYGATFAIVKK